MADIFRRAARAALFDRRPFQQALWESSATADAALIVITVGGLVALVGSLRAGFGPTGLITVVVGSVVSTLAAWLVLALATWFVGSRLFTPADSSARRFEEVQTMLKMHGLAFLPVLLSVFGGLGATGGVLWYLAAASLGTSVALDVRIHEGVIAVLLGAAVVAVFNTLLGAPFAIAGGLF